MPTNATYNLGENLHLCFSKLKCSSNVKTASSSTTLSSNTTQTPTKSPVSHDHKSKTETTVLLIQNFNSVYNSTNQSSDDQPSQAPPRLNSTNSSSSNSLSPRSSSSFSSLSEYAAAGSDGRFFFSSPGKSKSIVDDEAMSAVFSEDGGGKSGIILAMIPTYTTDPYADFRRSMEEMVVAQAQGFSDDDAQALWDYLHGLLLCYLALNRKNSHKFILGAFDDLLLSLFPAAHAVA